jgi:hypothetical protein
MLSASSSMIILCRPAGSVTFFCANVLIVLRTVSIPLKLRCQHEFHSLLSFLLTSRRKHLVPRRPPCTHLPARRVQGNAHSSSFQFPGGPATRSQLGAIMPEKRMTPTDISKCGKFPSSCITLSRSMVARLPTTSSNLVGRYFSTLR